MRTSTTVFLVALLLALLVNWVIPDDDTQRSQWADAASATTIAAAVAASVVFTVVQLRSAGLGVGRAALATAGVTAAYVATAMLALDNLEQWRLNDVESLLLSAMVLTTLGGVVGSSGYLGYTAAASALDTPQWASGVLGAIAAVLYMRFVAAPKTGLAFRLVRQP